MTGLPAAPSTAPLRRLRRLCRRLRWSRRPVAAALCGLAALIGVRTLAPPPASTEVVVVARADLAAGRRLQAGDLARAAYAPGTRPAGTTDTVATLIGSTLAAPVRRGEPVTDLRTVSAALPAGYDGLALVPVRIADPDQARLVHVGDVVDVWATDPESGDTRLLGAGVPITAIPRIPRQGESTLPGAPIVVAIAPAAVETFVRSSARDVLSVVLPPLGFDRPGTP